ncbi:Amine oxidase [Metarhizium brunneum]
MADVIIVGAGLSGLAAAEKLVAAGKSVVVLEARDRVGGKIYDSHFTTPTVRGYAETGASFIGLGQTEAIALSERLGLRLFDTYDKGMIVVSSPSGERKLFDPEDPKSAASAFSTKATKQLEAVVVQLDSMAAELDLTAPWSHPKAVEWDSQTLHSWICAHLSEPEAVAVHLAQWRAVLSAEAADVSLLQALTYIVKADGNSTERGGKGNWAQLISIKGGSLEKRVENGPQLLAIRLAERLGSNVVRTNSPVSGISKRGSEYIVHIEPRIDEPKSVATARSVILALSPPLVSRLRFEPPLPISRDMLGQRMSMGAVGKVIAVYETPFWRDDGLSGRALGLGDSHVKFTFDASPANASCGIIMGFLVGNYARRLDDMSDTHVQEVVAREYVHLFGPKAENVQHWIVQRWNREEYSRGGHFGFCPPNVMTVYGEDLAAPPVGDIFFAGTELSSRWAGFMEGAIRAGRAAADGIIERFMDQGHGGS